MGTAVNAALIVIGGILGTLLKNRFSTKMQDGLYKAVGIAVLVIGIMGLASNMLSVKSDGSISSSGELLLTISLALGCLIGMAVKLQDRMNQFSVRMEQKLHLSGFGRSFLDGSLIFCIGAMAIIGSINDGLLHQPQVLIVKGVLDGTTSVILAAAEGPGVIFSAIPVGLYQGAITLLAGSLSTVLAGQLLKDICMVGYALVFCIGLNFLFPEKIRTADLLPSLLIPIVWALISGWF
jgi:uncharacterized membrane protein YqgA involved in biofilm formation